MLEKIKKSGLPELEAIAAEVREQIIEVCSKNGGHLASSLGTVDLTIALLKVFDLEKDKIIWDVGHQAYSYKILTGRKEQFHTLRKFKGICGFPKMSESPYDFFGTGHGGTSISAALGLKEAMNSSANNSKVIAVIGDGAMTSGLAFEAMNHAESLGKNHITILNDNDMFISTGVGALSLWFSRKLSGPTSSTWRTEVKEILSKLPPFFRGERIIEIVRKTLDSSKSLLTPGILFEGFGYEYVGPIDGHNLTELTETMEELKTNKSPILLHVVTKKGKGYRPAEENPRLFHGIGPFNIESGEPQRKTEISFTDYLSDYLPGLFKRNKDLVAITAAMPDGTGLHKLQNMMPERFYDAGMSEGHAVTFAAGLAAGGKKPLVAIYSTFLQRAFDSIIHDVALQNLPVIFLIDRAGIVGEDGATHQGVFDIAYLRMIPGMTIMTPRDETEMARMIELAVKHDHPSVIRYPRGSSGDKKLHSRVTPLRYGKGEMLAFGDKDVFVVSVGIASGFALDALSLLEREKTGFSLYDLKFVKPLPEDLFDYILKEQIKKIVIVEDGIIAGGAGSAILEECARRGIKADFELLGVRDRFVPHGTQKELREREGISAAAIAAAVKKIRNR